MEKLLELGARTDLRTSNEPGDLTTYTLKEWPHLDIAVHKSGDMVARNANALQFLACLEKTPERTAISKLIRQRVRKRAEESRPRKLMGRE